MSKVVYTIVIFLSLTTKEVIDVTEDFSFQGDPEKWKAEEILKDYIQRYPFALNSPSYSSSELHWMIYKSFIPFRVAMLKSYAEHSGINNISKERPKDAHILDAAGRSSHIAIGYILQREAIVDFDPCYGTHFIIQIDSTLTGEFEISTIEVKILEGIGENRFAITTDDYDDYPWFTGDTVLLFLRSYPGFCSKIEEEHQDEIGWEANFYEVSSMFNIYTDSLGTKRLRFHVGSFAAHPYPLKDALKTLSYVLPLAAKWQKEIQSIPFEITKEWIESAYQIWYQETLQEIQK